MIHVIEGNILDATEDIIGHQVNCRGVMGSGVAKQMRDKYPNVYTEYKSLCDRKTPYELLGETQQIVVVDKWKYVMNIFGQLNYGRENVRYTDYDALFRGLKYLKDISKTHNKSVALPYKIGCGLANGDWDKVYNMIDEIFKRYEVTLYKFEI